MSILEALSTDTTGEEVISESQKEQLAKLEEVSDLQVPSPQTHFEMQNLSSEVPCPAARDLRSEEEMEIEHFHINRTYPNRILLALKSITAALKKSGRVKVFNKFLIDNTGENTQKYNGLASSTREIKRLLQMLTAKKPSLEPDAIRRFLRNTKISPSVEFEGGLTAMERQRERTLICQVHSVMKLLAKSRFPLPTSNSQKSIFEEIGVNKDNVHLALTITRNLQDYPELERYLNELRTTPESTLPQDQHSFNSAVITAIRNDRELLRFVMDVFTFWLMGSSEITGSLDGINSEMEKTVWRFFHKNRNNQARILVCGENCGKDHREILLGVIKTVLGVETIDFPPKIQPKGCEITLETCKIREIHKRKGSDLPENPTKYSKIPSVLNKDELGGEAAAPSNVCAPKKRGNSGNFTKSVAETDRKKPINLADSVKSTFSPLRGRLGKCAETFERFLTEFEGEKGLMNRTDFIEAVKAAEIAREGTQEFDNVLASIAAQLPKSQYLAFFKAVEATVIVQSTVLPAHRTGNDRSNIFTGIMSAAVSAELKEYREKVQVYLNACESPLVFIASVPQEGLIQLCYLVCREFLKPQPGSDYQTVLEACGIEVSSDSTIVAWSLLEATKRMRPERIALYAWLVETAGTSGNGWALLWPLWKHHILKDIFVKVLFLLIAYAKTDTVPEASFCTSKTTRLPDWNREFASHLRSLAVKVSSTLSVYINSTCRREHSSLPAVYFADPIEAIFEEISNVVVQVKQETGRKQDCRLRIIAKVLGVVYSDSQEQQSLLGKCWECASCKGTKARKEFVTYYLRLITFNDN